MKEQMSRARRRIKTRSAFFLLAASIVLSLLFYLLEHIVELTGAERVLAALLEEIVCFLLPAYFGLTVMDGNHLSVVRMRKMETGKMGDLFLSGVFLCAFHLLQQQIQKAMATMMGLGWMPASASAGAALFLPSLISVMLLQPACESLFFCGYLTEAFERLGKVPSLLIPAAYFVLHRGLRADFVTAFCLGMMMLVTYRQSYSLPAPMLLLAGYGFASVILEQCGITITSMGMLLTAVLVLCSVASLYFFMLACRAPVSEEQIQLPGRIVLNRREKLTAIAAAGMVILAIVTAEVLS